MNPMSTAPKEKRILIRHQVICKTFNEKTGRLETKVTGSEIVEAWWFNGEFILWCGTAKVKSTKQLHPLGWYPSPEDPDSVKQQKDADWLLREISRHPVALITGDYVACRLTKYKEEYLK